MTYDSENIHDEEKSDEIIEHPFHPLSFVVLYEGKSSNQCDHKFFIIHTSSYLWSEEYYDFSNLFVIVDNCVQTSDVDGFYTNDGDLFHSSCPHEIWDLT